MVHSELLIVGPELTTAVSTVTGLVSPSGSVAGKWRSWASQRVIAWLRTTSPAASWP